MSQYFAQSPAKTCMVRAANPPTNRGFHKTGRDFTMFTTPYDVTYHKGGMTMVDWNQGLRQPQRGEYLSFRYYNSGCAPIYCKDSTVCPGSANVTSQSEHSSAMFESLFNSPANYYVGNQLRPQCVTVKCDSYNSPSGWVAGPGGKPRWASRQ